MTLTCPRCGNTYTPTGKEEVVRCNGGTNELTGKPQHPDVDMVEQKGEGDG